MEKNKQAEIDKDDFRAKLAANAIQDELRTAKNRQKRKRKRQNQAIQKHTAAYESTADSAKIPNDGSFMATFANVTKK